MGYKVFCDNCGKEFEFNDTRYKVSIRVHRYNGGEVPGLASKKLDICEDCLENANIEVKEIKYDDNSNRHVLGAEKGFLEKLMPLFKFPGGKNE